VEQQALATIEEAETEDVVPEKSQGRDDNDVAAEGQPVAAYSSSGDEELCAKGAVTVHVLDVGFEGGIGVVDEVGVEETNGASALDGLVDGSLAEADWGWQGGIAATEEAKLRVGIVAAVADGAMEEEIAPGYAVGFDCAGCRAPGLHELAEFGQELGGELFVGVDGEYPGAGTFVDGRVLLRGEALPGLDEDFGVEGFRDYYGAVG